ncbi:hypothetical protein AWE51_02400 [Aquimarina aggregata]|uniref:Uncharacterized protein n=1 Tax=Aquimarina aggregata TaxID=1642818 RepID=A0A163CDW7_9FLAO|nr:hypothetical protein [Aquimarina aggregata]KZS42311.1 hypothetical protein AWE51_02400 [Aquimarina aggregata]
MLNLNCKIKVFETNDQLIPTDRVYEFGYAYDIQIESSYDNFTDTAVIKIPKKIIVNQLNSTLGFEVLKQLPIGPKIQSIYEYLKQDNYIEIFLGYNGDFKPAFRGYITEVKGDAPVCITCQDMMYLLKKTKMVIDGTSDNEDPQNRISQNPSQTIMPSQIKPILETKLQELGVVYEELKIEDNLSALIIDRKSSVANYLKCLKDQYKIYSFFKLENDCSKLHVTNNPDVFKIEEIQNFTELYKNTPSDEIPIPQALLNKAISILGIRDVLDFFSRDDGFIGIGRFRFFYNIIRDELKVNREQVTAIRMRAEKYFINSNTPIFVELGDPGDGELIETYTLHDNENELPTQDALFQQEEQRVKAELNTFLGFRLAKEKQTGLTGSFETFGEPFMRPTDRIILEDAEDEEKNGVFQVKKVKRSYGTSGYRQIISVGRRVED